MVSVDSLNLYELLQPTVETMLLGLRTTALPNPWNSYSSHTLQILPLVLWLLRISGIYVSL